MHVQSCLYMHMYINMHVHACVGEGEEEGHNTRTQNGGCYILSFWKVEELRKDPLRHCRGGGPHQIHSPLYQIATVRPGFVRD